VPITNGLTTAKESLVYNAFDAPNTAIDVAITLVVGILYLCLCPSDYFEACENDVNVCHTTTTNTRVPLWCATSLALSHKPPVDPITFIISGKGERLQ
jgi:hypothetical protein